MFDLDCLAAFDRGHAHLPQAVSGLTRDLDDQGVTGEAPGHARGGEARGVTRCTKASTLGVEPLCPFARTEVAA